MKFAEIPKNIACDFKRDVQVYNHTLLKYKHWFQKSKGVVASDGRVSGFLANAPDCEHRALQLKPERDHPLLHKTNRKESGEGERGERLE